MMRYWEEKKEVLTDETEASNIEISTAVSRASYGVDGAHGDKKNKRCWRCAEKRRWMMRKRCGLIRKKSSVENSFVFVSF
jgi:hypothetical protein